MHTGWVLSPDRQTRFGMLRYTTNAGDFLWVFFKGEGRDRKTEESRGLTYQSQHSSSSSVHDSFNLFRAGSFEERGVEALQ